MTDGELALLCRNGDKSAWEELYKKYKPYVLTTARRFFLSGGETEDLVQEGMFALYSAVNGYKEGISNFSAYACTCIKNRIIDTVKKSVGAKHSALNNFLPIVEACKEWISSDTPEDELIRGEDKKELLLKMRGMLSSLEYRALVMYTDGMTMAEISSALGKNPKSIDNAIHRAKHKLIKITAEE